MIKELPMTKRLYEREADLKQSPSPLKSCETGRHVIFGDGHGNVLKLLYTLIEEGILELSPEHYNALQEIYYRNYLSCPEQIKPDLDKFKQIVEEELTVKTHCSLTLIGDEVADRGNNDYFTLLILKKLSESKLDVSITLSNHGAEFIKMQDDNYHPHIDCSFIQSFITVQELIDLDLIEKDEIYDLIEHHYLPMIKAIDYTITPKGDGITLFSHAPIGLETIEALAGTFHIPYRDATLNEFINTIRLINQSVRQLVYDFPPTQFIERLQNEQQKSKDKQPIPLSAPLYRLIFNRKLGHELKLEPNKHSFKVNFVHGHVGDEDIYEPGFSPSEHIHVNLDNFFGKTDTYHKTTSLNSPPITHATLWSFEQTVIQRQIGLEHTIQEGIQTEILLNFLTDHAYGLSDLFELSSSQFSIQARSDFLFFLQQNSVLPLERILNPYELPRLLSLKSDKINPEQSLCLLALLPHLNPNGTWLSDLILLLDPRERRPHLEQVLKALHMDQVFEDRDQLYRFFSLPTELLSTSSSEHIIKAISNWEKFIPDIDAFYQLLVLPADGLPGVQRLMLIEAIINAEKGKFITTLITDPIALFVFFKAANVRQLSHPHREVILKAVLREQLPSWIESGDEKVLYDLFLLEKISLTDKQREMIVDAVFLQQHHQEKIERTLKKLLDLPPDKLPGALRKTIAERYTPVKLSSGSFCELFASTTTQETRNPEHCRNSAIPPW